jgi:predicted dehydrogenase
MKIYKVGLIGCGNIFPMHAMSLKNIRGVEIQAVCDIKLPRAVAQAQKYNCNYYTNYGQMFSKEQLDAVHILTPHHLHAPLAIYAAKKKVNILVEKPMALNPQEAQKMIEAAQENKVKLGVIFQNRYNPAAKLISARFKSRALGKLISAKLVLSWHKPDEYYSKSEWKGTKQKEGGGVVIDQAIHSLDLLNYLTNDNLDFVYAHVANRMHKIVKVEDVAEGIIKFKKGSYICFYTINYYSYDADVETELHCQKARVKIIKDSCWIEYYNGKKEKALPHPKDYIDYGDGVRDYWGHCHLLQIKDYYNSLRKNKAPFIDGAEAKKTQDLVWAIYKSSQTNRRIYFPIKPS